MAYFQDFESEEEDPNPFSTMSDMDDDSLQRLKLHKPLGSDLLIKYNFNNCKVLCTNCKYNINHFVPIYH